MKIVFVTTSFLVGGLERSSANISNYLCNVSGVQLTVVTQYKFKHFYQLDNKIKIVEPEFKKDGVAKLFYYLKVVFFFRKQFIIEKPDVILSFGEHCNFQTLLAGFFLNIPIIISDRASPELEIAFPTNLFRKLTYPFASGFIAQTDRMKQSLIQKFGINAPISVIPNAIRQVNLHPEIKRKNQIIAVGRIHPIKQFDLLIEAFETANTKDWELLIIGEGVDSQKIQQRISESTKADHIHLEAKTLNLDEKFAESKVFALTSVSEGFPNSLCEAMAAGLICVSFDIVAGPREIINHGVNGILLPPKSIQALTESFNDIIANENKYAAMSQNALNISEQLTLDKIGNQYLQFLISQTKSANAK